jgi:hypothetical protein
MRILIQRLCFVFILFSSVLYAQTDTAWTISLGGKGNDDAKCVRLLKDNSLIIIGTLNSRFTEYPDGVDDSARIYFAKINSNGKKIWEKQYGRTGYKCYGNTIEPTKDGGYIIAGGGNSHNRWVFSSNDNES